MRHYDLDALRAGVPISSVLQVAGFDVDGRTRRIRCPLHGGDNPSSFSFTTQHFKCFACDVGGDIFDLAMRLRSMSFREAVEHVASIAGMSPGVSPIRTRAQVLDRAVVARRRATLRTFRESRLNALAAQLHGLDCEVDAASARLTSVRDTGAEESAWSRLAVVCKERDTREFERMRLEVDSEPMWLDVLGEQRGLQWAA